MTTDVLVVGAGLAGLHVATLLARRGREVLLVDRRSRLTATIRTTGIFVRKTLEDFELPSECLGPPIRRVVLYPPGLSRPVELESERDEFQVGDMGALYESFARDAVTAGVQMLLGTRYTGRQGQLFLLEGPTGAVGVQARFVVGADGARSRVAADLELDKNTHLLVGAEEVYPVASHGEPPTFHCVLDPRFAPGYLAWVLTDGEHAHVGVAGYANRFPEGLYPALKNFRLVAPGLTPLDRPLEVEKRAGLIPVGGLLKRISSPEGLLVGDAAGAVSPLTAGGLDPCLRLSAFAAEILDAAFRAGDPGVLQRYDGAGLRERFRGRLLLRYGLSQVRSQQLTRATFSLLRTPPGRFAAQRILFGDRSFPDPDPQSTAKRRVSAR